MTIRVLLADDHQIVREALSLFLASEPDIEVVAEVGDGMELLTVAKQVRPSVVVIDINMPRLNGCDATRLLRRQHPEMKVIGLSAVEDRDVLIGLIRAGAVGCVSKSDPGKELVRAIRAAVNNRGYTSPSFAEFVNITTGNISSGDFAEPRLSRRERQVLQLVAEGMTSMEIARQMHLAQSTVTVHRRNIMRKLNLHSVAELTKYAIRKGVTGT